MTSYDAVLFDWVGTLVHYQRGTWRLRMAHENIGRAVGEDEFETLVRSIVDAYGDPDVAVAMQREDCSAAEHRTANMLWFDRAGLDPDLAEAVYAMDFDPATHPAYPDARETLAALHRLDLRIGIVSNFHRDLRPEIDRHGFSTYVDGLIVSYEHGIQKPDLAIFALALDQLDASANRTLMVGDSAIMDGAAASLGIDTLILPMPERVQVRGLDAVIRLTTNP